ncbi:MAG: hypothetical protein LEGION0403_FIIPPAGN_02929 [Legionella sp.]
MNTPLTAIRPVCEDCLHEEEQRQIKGKREDKIILSIIFTFIFTILTSGRDLCKKGS